MDVDRMYVKKLKSEVVKPRDEQKLILCLKTAKDNNEVYSRKGLIVDVYDYPLSEVENGWNVMSTECRRLYIKIEKMLAKLVEQGKVLEIKETFDGAYAYEWIGN